MLFRSRFAFGFYFGCIFLVLSLYQYFRLKGELARFRRHLSDKLENAAEVKAEGEAVEEDIGVHEMRLG